MQEVLDILPSMKDIVVEEQEWYLRKLFHLIDDDNSNSIDKTELLEAMDKREVRGEYTYLNGLLERIKYSNTHVLYHNVMARTT